MFLKNMASAPKHRQGTSRRKRQTDVPEDLKTVVTGFSEKDLRANNQTFNKNLVTSFVNELAEIRFHTYEILAIYGLLVATKYGERGQVGEHDEDLLRFKEDAAARAMAREQQALNSATRKRSLRQLPPIDYGAQVADSDSDSASRHDEDSTTGRPHLIDDIFHQTLIDQAMSLARYADDNRPRASQAPPLLQRASAMYFAGDGLENIRSTRAPVNGTFPTSILQMERDQIRVSMQNSLDISTASHQKMAIGQLYNLRSKDAKKICDQLQTSLELRANRATWAQTAAAAYAQRPLAPHLQPIFDLEISYVPPTQSQRDQLDYRFNLLSRLSGMTSLPPRPQPPKRQRGNR